MKPPLFSVQASKGTPTILICFLVAAHLPAEHLLQHDHRYAVAQRRRAGLDPAEGGQNQRYDRILWVLSPNPRGGRIQKCHPDIQNILELLDIRWRNASSNCPGQLARLMFAFRSCLGGQLLFPASQTDSETERFD